MRRDAPTERKRPGASDGDVEHGDVAAGLRLHRRGRAPGVVRLDASQSFTLGRGAQADLLFDDDDVSRVHATLKFEGGAWVLVDARSQNGSFVSRGVVSSSGFAEARPLVPGAPCVVGVSTVVYFGGAAAAVEGIDEATLRAALSSSSSSSSSSSRSARGQRFEQELARAAAGQGPVLLIGASGAGKTWAARRIHDESHRRGRFITLNAAALPHDPAQLRSVLLGHKKGAFTGAVSDVDGSFVVADGGTLFIDEVDSLPEAAQGFFLTLLEQSGDLRALGADPGGANRALDVRVVTASKVPLAQAPLRRDLSFRLVDGAIVAIPSLRERREDIPAIIAALCADLAREDGVAASFDDDAVALCANADWPGEVRQLRGLVRLLCREARADHRAVVTAADVAARRAALDAALGEAMAAPTTQRALAEAPARPKSPRALTRDDVEAALTAESGNIQRAAARLGVARNTLVTKMDAFGIAREGKRGS